MKYLLLLTFLFTSCIQTQSTSRTQVIMGTFCTITLEEKHSQDIDAGFTHLKNMESILSSYQSTALVSKLNSNRTILTYITLKDILEKSKKYYKQTHGYFDISIGSITKKLYHFGEEEKIPTQKEIHTASLGINSIVLSQKDIHLEDNITIDLGGIGKGYGVDSLSVYYANKGIRKGKIALSGDIRCLDACKVGIQNPFKEDETISIFNSKVPNLSISTSGTYRRYIEDKKHHHLINPKTKTQGRSFVSVTIVAKANNTLCDAMATAISTMPKDVALKFVKSQSEFGYFLITPDGEKILGNLEKFVDFKHSL